MNLTTAVAASVGDDPSTMDLQLCDDDGIVRRGAMHHGTDYPCTGHAHFGGKHLRCTGPAHQPVQPAQDPSAATIFDLLRLRPDLHLNAVLASGACDTVALRCAELETKLWFIGELLGVEPGGDVVEALRQRLGIDPPVHRDTLFPFDRGRG